MISDFYTLQDILLGFENTLRIEYTENNSDRILKEAKNRIENAYQIKLDKPIYDVQAQNALTADSITIFLEKLSMSVQSLAAYTNTVMFNKLNGISLADVNYLGFTAETLRAALKYLQDKNLYERRGSFIPAIRNAVNNIDMSQVKRLFVIMLLLEELGVKEAVSVVAQYLYICSLDI